MMTGASSVTPQKLGPACMTSGVPGPTDGFCATDGAGAFFELEWIHQTANAPAATSAISAPAAIGTHCRDGAAVVVCALAAPAPKRDDVNPPLLSPLPAT